MQSSELGTVCFMSSKKKNFKTPTAALTAGALQDHLLHDLALGDLSLSSPLKSYSDLKQKLRDDERRRRIALKNVKPTVDTGRITKALGRTKTKIDREPEKEYVLDPLPKPSLAQKMGLVSQPDKPLTTEEWTNVKNRSIARDDFKNPCAICQEYFRTEDQVLLSCSHVFHKACIQAFERFTGKKTCPMCRKIQYQARVVHDGTRFYKSKAVVRIQSFWRGYVVRKWYSELRRTVPPNDPKLRQRFYEDKLKEITDRMVAMTSTETVDRFLQDIDDSIAASRAVFQHFENSCLHRLSDEDWIVIEVRALERDDKDCPICLRSLHFNANKNYPTQDKDVYQSKDLRTVKPRTVKDSQKTTKPKKGRRSGNWNRSASPPLPAAPRGSSLTILSCSHLFHKKCLEALEDFCLMESVDARQLHYGQSASPTMQHQLKCPVCRSLYVKRVLE